MTADRQGVAAVAAWLLFWGGLFAWSNFATESSPLDQWPTAVSLVLFGVLPQLALGWATGRAWVALSPFALMAMVSLVVLVASEDSTEGPIGVVVLWVLAVPAATVILVGALIRKTLRRDRESLA